MRILIVGGGISGLVAATQLQRDHTVTLVERNDHLGGRIHSMKHYECGAFRIHASHKRVFALAKRLKVKLAPWSFTTVHLGMKTPSEKGGKETKAKDGMSWWDLEANKGGLKLAEWKDFASGYRSSTGANSMTYPLDMDESEGWYFAPKGLSALTEALIAKLTCTVHLSTRLVDCETNGKHVYKASFLSRNKSKKSFSSRYDTVIFATSPVDLQTISVIKDHGCPWPTRSNGNLCTVSMPRSRVSPRHKPSVWNGQKSFLRPFSLKPLAVPLSTTNPNFHGFKSLTRRARLPNSGMTCFCPLGKRPLLSD